MDFDWGDGGDDTAESPSNTSSPEQRPQDATRETQHPRRRSGFLDVVLGAPGLEVTAIPPSAAHLMVPGHGGNATRRSLPVHADSTTVSGGFDGSSEGETTEPQSSPRIIVSGPEREPAEASAAAPVAPTGNRTDYMPTILR